MENKPSIHDAFSTIVAQMQEISEQGKLSEIERDLLLDNIRNFYVVVKQSPCDAVIREEKIKEHIVSVVAKKEEIPVVNVSTQDNIARQECEPCVAALEIETGIELSKEEPEPEAKVVMQTPEPENENPNIESVSKEKTILFETNTSLPVAEEKKDVDKETKLSAETLFDFTPAEPTPQEVRQAEKRIPEVLNYLNQNLYRKNTSVQTPTEESVPVSTPVQGNTQRKTLAENFAPSKSLIDSFSDQKDKAETNIATRMGQTHKDLRTAIGVNEKFMFINDLFAGNMRSYTDFISQLNREENGADALRLVKQMADTRHWVETSLAYTTLVSVIDKKFAK